MPNLSYKKYMQQVKDALLDMSEQEKDEWIYNVARTTSEKQRESLLSSLTVKEGKAEVDQTLLSAKKEIEVWCEKVESMDIYFRSEGYETYGQDYWEPDWEYEYFDELGIGEKITKGFQLADQFLSLRQYKHAKDLYETLSGMTYYAFDDSTGEMEELYIDDLVKQNLVSLGLTRMIQNMMYATYQVLEGEQRARNIYLNLHKSQDVKIKIEQIFTVGPEELIGTDRFMEEWIAYLKNESSDKAENLLYEACMYVGGIDLLAKTAKEAWEKHPSLFEKACNHYLNENKLLECERLGVEAIRVLPKTLIIRGKIANIVANVAKQLEHFDVMKECYVVSFYSASTLNHYLRLFELPEFQDVTESAAKFAMKLEEEPEESVRYFYHTNLAKNHMSKEQKMAIRFFNGKFDELATEFMKNKTVLGWSTDHKGIIIPLFILLLNKNNEVSKASQRLLEELENRLDYIEEDQTFTEQFLFWKEKFELTSEQYETYMEWVLKEVDLRAEGIVGGGLRGSYHKVAQLITAVGEAMESNGQPGAKENLIKKYVMKHSRKTAFKSELAELR